MEFNANNISLVLGLIGVPGSIFGAIGLYIFIKGQNNENVVKVVGFYKSHKLTIINCTWGLSLTILLASYFLSVNTNTHLQEKVDLLLASSGAGNDEQNKKFIDMVKKSQETEIYQQKFNDADSKLKKVIEENKELLSIRDYCHQLSEACTVQSGVLKRLGLESIPSLFYSYQFYSYQPSNIIKAPKWIYRICIANGEEKVMSSCKIEVVIPFEQSDIAIANANLFTTSSDYSIKDDGVMHFENIKPGDKIIISLKDGLPKQQAVPIVMFFSSGVCPHEKNLKISVFVNGKTIKYFEPKEFIRLFDWKQPREIFRINE